MSTVKERLKEFIKFEGLTVKAFEASIGAGNAYVNSIVNTIGAKYLPVILERYPHINREWLLFGEGEMLKQAEEPAAVVNYTDGVPYYDEDFMLGFDELVAPSSENPAFLVRMPGYERATLWCNASGRSMEPEIDSGDIIALQRIDDFSFLPLGDIYGIITTNGMRTIKRIGRGSREGYLRLIPTNPAYDEQEIHLSQIAILYRVLGALKSF